MGRMTPTGLAAALSQASGEVFAVLVTLSHPTWAAPIRVSSDGVNTRHANQTYERFPFNITMPEQNGRSVPRVTLSICNVDREIVQQVRTARQTNTPIQVEVKAIRVGDEEGVEAGPYTFALREVEYDAVVVEGVLGMEDLLNEPFPKDTYSPAMFPGLFA